VRQCIPLSLGVRCCWSRACEGSSHSSAHISWLPSSPGRPSHTRCTIRDAVTGYKDRRVERMSACMCDMNQQMNGWKMEGMPCSLDCESKWEDLVGGGMIRG